METAEPDLQLALEWTVTHDDADARAGRGRGALALVADQRAARAGPGVAGQDPGRGRAAHRRSGRPRALRARRCSPPRTATTARPSGMRSRRRRSSPASGCASGPRSRPRCSPPRTATSATTPRRAATSSSRSICAPRSAIGAGYRWRSTTWRCSTSTTATSGARSELFEQSLAIKRELGEQRSIAIGLANLADVAHPAPASGRTPTGCSPRALALATGIPQIVGTIRCNQGNLAAHREDWTAAAGHFQAAITASQAGGHPHDAVEAMIGLARVWYHTGRPADGLAQLLAARTLAAELGSPQRIADVDAALAELAPAAGTGRRLAAAAGAGPAGARTRQPDRPPGRGARAARGRPQQQADRRAARPQSRRR